MRFDWYCVQRVEFGIINTCGNKISVKSHIERRLVQSIIQEIYLLKQLKHEDIVKYIDCIETDQFLNIILEYIESGSLASILKKFESFPKSLVAIYGKQVLKGLEYLHQYGIVHIDIKGANILTTKDGTVKLADFGVATTWSEDTTQSNKIVGTPYWMAPGAIEISGNLSTSCDIWSLGCTVIELLTGNPPYFDRLQYAAMFQIVQRDCPPLPEGISNECRDFLLQCFQKDPTLRADATTMLKHQWITKCWHIVQGPNLPEEVTNIIRNHIVDQSNFGTFITDSLIEQVPQLIQSYNSLEKLIKAVLQGILDQILLDNQNQGLVTRLNQMDFGGK